MTLNYNSPANFSISIDYFPKKYVLKPLEVLTEYCGMKVLEPDASVPVRRYQPEIEMQRFSENILSGIKPGFKNQYQEFSSMVHGNPRKIGASLNDALAAIKLAEEVTKGFKIDL